MNLLSLTNLKELLVNCVQKYSAMSPTIPLVRTKTTETSFLGRTQFRLQSKDYILDKVENVGNLFPNSNNWTTVSKVILGLYIKKARIYNK